jgi:hypothetical protein
MKEFSLRKNKTFMEKNLVSKNVYFLEKIWQLIFICETVKLMELYHSFNVFKDMRKFNEDYTLLNTNLVQYEIQHFDDCKIMIDELIKCCKPMRERKEERALKREAVLEKIKVFNS